MPFTAEAVATAQDDRSHDTTVELYSLTSENVTKIKRNSAQILSYKIFSFCEQILKIGANDASGQGLQYAL